MKSHCDPITTLERLRIENHLFAEPRPLELYFEIRTTLPTSDCVRNRSPETGSRATLLGKSRAAANYALKGELASLTIPATLHGSLMQAKRQMAYELLAPVYGWFTEGFDTAGLIDATIFWMS